MLAELTWMILWRNPTIQPATQLNDRLQLQSYTMVHHVEEENRRRAVKRAEHSRRSKRGRNILPYEKALLVSFAQPCSTCAIEQSFVRSKDLAKVNDGRPASQWTMLLSVHRKTALEEKQEFKKEVLKTCFSLHF